MKLAVKEERCSGCNVCRVVCALHNAGAVQPSQALLKNKGAFPDPGTYKIAYCNQCGICADSCPEDAISESDGEYNIDYELCTQCLICIESCPFDVIVVTESEYPAKCTGCGKCVELCPRQAGRTGIAAVLGSKNIKAVAVRGTKAIPVFDAEGAQKKGEEMYKVCFGKPGFKTWTPFGTASITGWANEVGAFPTRNFQTSYADFHEKIIGQAIIDRLLVTDKGCFGCPTPCGKYGHTQTALGSAYVEGPEYESIATLGGSCCLEEIEEVAYANYVCDQLGLDTISAGVVVSFAMECFEKGVISAEEVGRELSFGSLEDTVYLFEKIAAREGIGKVLSGGVKYAAAVFGGGSESYAIHVKGLEWSGYECRNAPGMMLSYMTADVGAHHNRSWALGYDVSQSDADVSELIEAGTGTGGKLEISTPDGKVDNVISMQHSRPLYDVLGICCLQSMEIGFETYHYEEVFELITGRRLSWKEMLTISERIWQLTRQFNVKHIEGFGRSWDYPPRRFMEEPVTSGPNEGRLIRKEILDKMLDEYYQKRGWNNDGIPELQTLARFGLD